MLLSCIHTRPPPYPNIALAKPNIKTQPKKHTVQISKHSAGPIVAPLQLGYSFQQPLDALIHQDQPLLHHFQLVLIQPDHVAEITCQLVNLPPQPLVTRALIENWLHVALLEMSTPGPPGGFLEYCVLYFTA